MDFINLDTDCIGCGVFVCNDNTEGCDDDISKIVGLSVCKNCAHVLRNIPNYNKYNFTFKTEIGLSFCLCDFSTDTNSHHTIFFSNKMICSDKSLHGLLKILSKCGYKNIKIISDTEFTFLSIKSLYFDVQAVKKSTDNIYEIQDTLGELCERSERNNYRLADVDRALLDTRLELSRLKKDINNLKDIMTNMMNIFKASQ